MYNIKLINDILSFYRPQTDAKNWREMIDTCSLYSQNNCAYESLGALGDFLSAP
jgi:hypothetical protein